MIKALLARLGRQWSGNKESRMGWASMPVRRIHPTVSALAFSLQAHDCYIAGGYARWACSTREDTPLPKDIDIVCPSKRKLESLRASFKTNGMVEVRDGVFSVTFKTGAIGREIQLLKPFTGDTIEECLSKFDLSVCRVALINHDSAIGDTDGFEDERQGKVRVSHVDPETASNTMCRLLRYANKGYEIETGEVEKVLDVIRKQAIASIPAVSSYDHRGSAYSVGS